MTMHFHSASNRHSRPFGGYFGDSVFARLRRFLTLPIVWHERSCHRRHLLTLDDRLLRDVDLARHDIELEANKWFWEP